jgi:hypothetical protein
MDFMLSNTSWQDLYRDAVVAMDPSELETKIRTAQAAIHKRNEELGSASDPASQEEKLLLVDALNSLSLLMTYELKSKGSTSV